MYDATFGAEDTQLKPARYCIKYAFERLDNGRIIALVRPENLGSCRVAEKNGMKCERVIYWRGYDHCVYVKQRSIASAAYE
jgi:RimJ/RimL family protein N-acetyltransferase